MNKDLIYALRVGDKIICNKEYYHRPFYVYNECDVYVILYVYIHNIDTYVVFAEHVYKKYPVHGFTEKELESNWVTIAEWRDRQILY